MPLEIEIGTLASRAVRRVTTPGGVKRIATSMSQIQRDNQGGVIGWIVGGILKFGGFLLSAIWNLVAGALSWTLSQIWTWAIQTFHFVWYFDWNASDESIDATIEAQYQSLLTQAGGTLGSMVGWLIGGVVPGAFVMVFNEPLGVKILNDVGQEALEELAPRIGDLVRSTIRATTRHALLATYKRARNYMMGKNPVYAKSDSEIDEEYAARVDSGEMTLEQANEAIQKTKRVRDASKEGFQRKPWSFQKKFEEWRENNLPQWLQEPAEEFIEEMSEGIIEAGYVVANRLDAEFATQSLTAPAINGSQRIVKIDFNRNINQPSQT